MQTGEGSTNSGVVGTHSGATAANSRSGVARLQYLENGCAIVRLGATEERVVTLTVERINSIREIVSRLKQEKPKGLIFTGSSAEMFTAGADINLIKTVDSAELGSKLAREGQALFDEIAALPFPTVAAISGPCVGGGCELALACTYRVISSEKSSVIGLPEIQIGILPGFGGTQRLPRLIGLPKALDIILAGKSLRPKQALAAGLVDDIVKYELLEDRAVGIACGAQRVHRRTIPLMDRLLTFTSLGRSIVKRKAGEKLRKQTKGFYPAPPAALEAACYGLKHGLQKGLEFEARELGRLIITAESKALVHLFFLTDAAKSLGKSGRKALENLHAIVVGAGVMGAGIAAALAKAEYPVILKDTADDAVRRGMDHIKRYLSELRYLNESEKSSVLNRIEATSRDSASLSSANFLIEAVFENMTVKKQIFSSLAKEMAPGAILATNTSSLSVSEIAEGVDDPSRVVGMHFFNPVERMLLVEIVRAKNTSDKTLAIVAALTSKLGKFPIIVQDVPGFLVNRVLSPYLNEAAFLLEEGYPITEIDRAALEFGMPMGPIRLLDEVGLDVAAHVQEIMVAGYGDRMRGPQFAKVLVEQGRKGKKSGAGFYEFSAKENRPDPQIRSRLKLSGNERSAVDRRAIAERLVVTLINEAVRCLDEGIAGVPGPEAADQIDLGTVMGMGFPPFRGGAISYADTLGAARIVAILRALAAQYGSRFEPAPGLVARAAGGARFRG